MYAARWAWQTGNVLGSPTMSLHPPSVATVTPFDNAELVAALRSGDELAFADLVERLHHSLVRLARLYVADNVAEDVAQETWLALLRGLDRFEGRASLKTWLFRVLVNRARTRATREARTVPFSSLVNAETETFEPAVSPDRFRGAADRWPGHWLVKPASAPPEQQLLDDELYAHVRAAVAKLPPAQREVVTLRDIDGLAADEVCQLLDLSDVNQRVLLHRGRSKVRAALEHYVAARATSA
jgi:RNA polymerase sigma-70 factor (ECF subfamily)